MIYVKKNVRVLPDDTDVFGRLNWLGYVAGGLNSKVKKTKDKRYYVSTYH
jgi:hypothetical protein